MSPNEKTYLEKTYLGDSVYVSFDGFHIILETDNGIEVTNRVYLDPAVFEDLIEFHKNLQVNHVS